MAKPIPSRRRNASARTRSNSKAAPSEATAKQKSLKFTGDVKNVKLAKPSKSRLRGRAAQPENGADEWVRIRCVIPASVAPLWDFIQERLRELEVEHHNKGIEAGMHLEILCAEFLSSDQHPRPEEWSNEEASEEEA